MPTTDQRSAAWLEDRPEYVAHVSGPWTPLPTAVNLELTTRCNLKCHMCPTTHGLFRTTGNRDMSPELLDRVIAEIVPRVARVDLVGDGELLLVPQLLRKLLEATDRHGVLVNMSTNGLLLSNENARMLVERRVADVSISVDAATPETYKRLRGADLNRILKNLDALAALKKDAGSRRPAVQLSMVAMRPNVHELPALVELAAAHGVEAVLVQAFGNFAGLFDADLVIEDRAQALAHVETAAARARDLGVRLNRWPSDLFADVKASPGPDGADSTAARRVKDCSFPWDVPYVTVSGDVVPCCALPAMGSLSQASFDGVWNGDAFRTLRRSLVAPEPREECRLCPGRGWRPPAPVREAIDASDPRAAFGLGWHQPAVEDGLWHRWTGDQATFFVEGTEQTVLELDVTRRGDAQPLRRVEVRVNGAEVGRLDLPNQTWHRLHFILPEPAARLAKVDITVAGTFRPRDQTADNPDPRTLGLRMSTARLTASAMHAAYEDGITLLGCDALAAEWRRGDEARLTLYWRVPEAFPAGLFVFAHVFRIVRTLPPAANALAMRLASRLGPRVFVQADHPLPAPGASAVPIWPAVLSVDPVELRLPANLAPGEYGIGVGLWRPATGRRLRRLPDAAPAAAPRPPLASSRRRSMTLLGTVRIV